MSGMDDDDDDDEDVGRGGNRGNGMRDDEDASDMPASSVTVNGILEVAGDDGQKLNYRQGAISLEQARRLLLMSATRGAVTG